VLVSVSFARDPLRSPQLQKPPQFPEKNYGTELLKVPGIRSKRAKKPRPTLGFERGIFLFANTSG
jgi:hypothetical protein